MHSTQSHHSVREIPFATRVEAMLDRSQLPVHLCRSARSGRAGNSGARIGRGRSSSTRVIGGPSSRQQALQHRDGSHQPFLRLGLAAGYSQLSLVHEAVEHPGTQIYRSIGQASLYLVARCGRGVIEQSRARCLGWSASARADHRVRVVSDRLLSVYRFTRPSSSPLSPPSVPP